jgi:periplasmic divalent cation tolerance protein
MRILITSTPPSEAEQLVQKLLQEKLIGCGNIWGNVQSMYWWKGEIQRDPEALILMETKTELVEEAIKRIATLHSYEVPKILAIEPQNVYQAYHLWLQEETR